MNSTSMTKLAQFLVFGLLVFLTACSPRLAAQPTSVVLEQATQPVQDTGMINTAVAQTVQARTPTLAAVTATLAAAATATPVTPAQPEVGQPSATTAPAAAVCQDAAQYVTDDGLDGTTYAPNTAFTKMWMLKNTGSCTWDSNYRVSYISGTMMTQQPGYYFVPEGQMVAPGQTVNINVGMTAPAEVGNYESYWGLTRGSNRLMPIQGGYNGNSFYVKMRVNQGGAAGRVTNTGIAITQEQGSGSVCTASSTYFVQASITTDGPTTASYEIGSTAGQIPAGNFQDATTNTVSRYVTGTIVFDQADTKTINLRFIGPYPHPDDITVNMRVNDGEWQNTKLSCQ